MTELRLAGTVRFKELRKGTKPAHQFLPDATHVSSGFDEVQIRFVERYRMDISWEAIWEGEDLCREVLRKAKRQLDHYTSVQKVYERVRPLFKGDPATDRNMDILVRENQKRVSSWRAIVKTLIEQTDTQRHQSSGT